MLVVRDLLRLQRAGLRPAAGDGRGRFILDYIMPAGTLADRDRTGCCEHVEQILRNTPEVETTSRRTGLQMGLAAVTEANYRRLHGEAEDEALAAIDDVIADVRAEIKKTEPALDVEFTQVLQDMIGDLSNAPEPIQVKLFHQRSGGAERSWSAG